MVRLMSYVLAALVVGGLCECPREPAQAPCVAGCCHQLPVAVRLQQATVSVRLDGEFTGSGVVFRAKDSSLWVWTAAHVVATDDLAHHLTESQITVVLPDRSEVPAEAVRFNAAEDLALLRLEQDNVAVESIVFHTGRRPPVGTPLYHVGSPRSLQGTVTTGVISRLGFRIEGATYDQASTPVYGGSSGGAICLRSDGRLLGLVCRAVGLVRQGGCAAVAYYAPTWRIRAYARRTGVAFAVDNAVDVPSNEDLVSGGVEQ